MQLAKVCMSTCVTGCQCSLLTAAAICQPDLLDQLHHLHLLPSFLSHNLLCHVLKPFMRDIPRLVLGLAKFIPTECLVLIRQKPIGSEGWQYCRSRASGRGNGQRVDVIPREMVIDNFVTGATSFLRSSV